MKYTIDDIPYLVGLHFRLSKDAKRDWVYHIHSYRFEDIYIDWPHRDDKQSPLARYPADVFLENLNDGTWIITDLPSIDISSVLKEESDSLHVPKVGDVLIAKEDLLYAVGKTRFATKDKEYPITEVEVAGGDNDGYVIMDDNDSRHTLSLGFIHKYFNIIDHMVNMDHIINQLFESDDSYRPKLNLKFRPPIENEGELDKILETIHNTYPTVRWYGDNDILTYNPIGMESNDEDEEIQVHFLTIGYFPSKPNSLTYSSYADDNEWVATSIDGREWLESKKIDIDDVFNKLYESKIDNNLDNYKPPIGSYLICHTNGYMFDEDGEPTGKPFATEGKEYEIIGYRDVSRWGCKEALIILDDMKMSHSFGVTGCDDGPDYLKWFYPSTEVLPSHEDIWKTMNEQEDDFGWAKDIVSSMSDLPKPNHYVSIIFLKRNQSKDSIHNLLTHLDLLGWKWKVGDYLRYERVISNITRNYMYDEPHIVLQRNGMLSYGIDLESFEETFGIDPSNCKTYSYPTSVIKEQEDDLGWAKHMSQNLDYWSLLQRGQTIIIKPHHDPKQQEYFKATLTKCRKASTPSFYYGKTIKVMDIHEFDRPDIDCFACEDFSLDCSKRVKAIEAFGFWVSSDMVDIEIIP